MQSAITDDAAFGPTVGDEANDPCAIDEQALFREARRLRRRRWAIRAIIVLVLVVVGAVAVWLIAGQGHARAAHGKRATAALPTGPVTSLGVAGALAVGPTGALYVSDVARHRVLVRLSDGRFRVVAGTGTAGYSGNGASALHARLSTVTGLTFSPAGGLYLVDGGRVRVITPAGIIRTIAGDGRPARPLSAGTPALSAPLGTAQQNAGPSIAVAPDGELYIATPVQLLRLTGRGTLTPVRDIAATGPVHGSLDALGDIAVDGQGNVDVSGVNGWSVWQVTPNGRAHQVGPGSGARQSGGNYSVLQRAPNGNVYAENGPHILRVTPQHLLPAFTITSVDHQYFWPTYFAFGTHGHTYLDEIPGNGGFEAHQQLIAIHDHHITLLWQEHNRGHQDSFGPG